jgi:hypothetical protein
MIDIPFLLKELTSGDDTRADEVVGQLAEAGEIVLGELEKLLESGDPDRRWWGLRVLAQMEAPPLGCFVAALDDAEPEIRQCAALGLCYHPDESAVPSLVGKLDDPDPLTATLAANALVAVGKEATPALLAVLEGGGQAARIEAVRALSEIRDPRAIPALMRAIEGSSTLMQYWAESGLDKLGLDMVYLKPE